MVFYYTYVMAVLILVIPGYLMLRSMGFARTWSIALSPLVTASMLAVLGCAFTSIGVFCNAPLLLSTSLVIDAVLILVMRAWHKGEECSRELGLPSIDWRILLVYVFAGLLLGYYVFYRSIPGPNALFQDWDFGHHINVTRAMMDSGRFSVFGTNAYMTAKDIAIAPLGVGKGFYPTGVYFLYAIVCQVSGSALAVCINAVNLAFCCSVFPLGVAAVISLLFPDDQRMLSVGAVASLCLVGCPWNFLAFGPLFPNLAGMASVPVYLLFFVFLISPHVEDFSARTVLILLFLLVTIGIGCLHPNSLFSAALVLIPYLFHRLWVRGDIEVGHSRCLSGHVLAVCFAVLCGVLWYVAYRVLSIASPGLTTFYWAPFASMWQEIINILTQSYLGGFPGFEQTMVTNFIPAFLVIAGAYTTVHDRDSRWLFSSYILACLVCFVSATTDGNLRHVLAGFWYTDPVRLAATASMAAIPLAVIGGARLVKSVEDLVCRRRSRSGQSMVACEGLILLAIAMVIYMPSFVLPGYAPFPTAFGGFRQGVHNRYYVESPLSKSEDDFLTHVKEITGDSLVINNPWDGSHIAYGLDDVRTYYRGFTGFDGNGETPESKLIREHLDEYASRPDVREAVKKLNAKYVLILDKPSERGTYIMRTNPDPNLFKGIRRAGSWSPAFTEILTSDDGTSHLYKISQ